MCNVNTIWTIAVWLIGASTVWAQPAGACDPWSAKIVSTQGKVEARRQHGGDWQPAPLNAIYCNGDSIRVGDNSRAAILLANQTLLRLDQNSAITVTAIKPEGPSLLDILNGLVHFISRVPHSLKVNTPYVNAAIEGTEFVVAVTTDEVRVTVFEGKVLAQNSAGEVRLTQHETVIATALDQVPQKVLLAKPRDAVQWALYYPPILTPADGPLYETSLLLYRGRVDAAREQLNTQRAQTDAQGKIAALETIIAVVNNEQHAAVQFAENAVKLAPNAAASHIAMSYARQALFDLEGAQISAAHAVQLEPDNALALARLAELQLANGELDAALNSAKQAAQRDPQNARAQTILGFANLIQIRLGDALGSFERAILADQADPLPRLGSGLARIRRNDLIEGRQDIEIAAMLDPNNALIRSYLGKAYFEEKRSPLDADQYDMAKQLDPNDPTPWFYDAIRKHSDNRPVAALADLQQSIERNDNRAVYRSRLQLDQDQAVRSANQARIYNTLGFEQQAQMEAAKSLAYDPANHSAHRFLSDTYAGKPRHEIARSSELLQSQLLQPLSLTPLQPSSTEANLNTLTTQGPARAALNEFTPLFVRNGAYATASTLMGNNNTVGDEVVVAGLYDRFAYSIGQYSYNTDGYRDNANVNHDIANAFVQVQLTNQLDIQYEYRNRRTNQGDLRQDFNPTFTPRDQRSLDEDTNRIGLHYKVSPQSHLLASYIDNERDTFFFRSPPIPIRTTLSQQSDDRQLQYLWRGQRYNVIAGAGISEVNGISSTSINNGTPSTSFPEIDQYNYYIYNNYVQDNLSVTLGVSYESYESLAPVREFDEINPKFGLVWDITPATKFRIAAYQALKRALVANQTLEPTQLAGFNQFFDDVNGTKIYAFGTALDFKTDRDLQYGLEHFRRDLQVPETAFGGGITTNANKQDQYRVFLNWNINDRVTINTEYLYETLVNQTKNPREIETISIPIALRYFSPSGVSSSVKTTYVKQSNVFSGSTSFSQREDNFTLVDIGLSYRFPKRLGSIGLEVNNLFDQEFIYQDYYIFSGDSFNHTPRYLPDRSVVVRLTVYF